MNDLLSGIDDSFFDAVPTPEPTPKKDRVDGGAASRLSLLQKTPSKQKTPKKHLAKSPLSARQSARVNAANNMDALLEGAENWDWDDMNADFMTPEANRIQDAMVSLLLMPYAVVTQTHASHL